jgi:hypothetical protein
MLIDESRSANVAPPPLFVAAMNRTVHRARTHAPHECIGFNNDPFCVFELRRGVDTHDSDVDGVLEHFVSRFK